MTEFRLDLLLLILAVASLVVGFLWRWTSRQPLKRLWQLLLLGLGGLEMWLTRKYRRIWTRR